MLVRQREIHLLGAKHRARAAKCGHADEGAADVRLPPGAVMCTVCNTTVLVGSVEAHNNGAKHKAAEKAAAKKQAQAPRPKAQSHQQQQQKQQQQQQQQPAPQVGFRRLRPEH